MTFKASKIRKRRAPEPVGEGTQLIASAAIRDWYQKQLRAVTNAMLDDYRATINAALKTKTLKRFYANDASAQAQLSDVMAALNKKWLAIFKNYAKVTAEAFSEKVDKHSRATCWHSLSTAGVQQPRLPYTENIANTLGAAQKFNNTLITGIQVDAHEKIFNAVMLSLTSPNPEEQGTSGIENALKKTGEFTSKRIELIARDQNSKLYSSLNVERMKDNGVDKFRWVHSSAGKMPRPSHVAKDGEIFDLDDARLWTGPKADQGPPGWAVNCRCRAVPVID
jgi:SPP1 gp7 family putative phage head morphogenesis protein